MYNFLLLWTKHDANFSCIKSSFSIQNLLLRAHFQKFMHKFSNPTFLCTVSIFRVQYNFVLTCTKKRDSKLYTKNTFVNAKKLPKFIPSGEYRLDWKFVTFLNSRKEYKLKSRFREPYSFEIFLNGFFWLLVFEDCSINPILHVTIFSIPPR